MKPRSPVFARLRLAGCFACGVLAFLLSARGALAGTEITVETRRAGAPPEAKPQQSRIAVEGRKLHVDTGDGRHVLVYRGDEGVLQIIDHARKNVVTIDRATAQAVSRKVEGAKDQIRSRAAALPDAQREAVERWLGSDAPKASLVLRATGRTDRVNGIDCRLLEALRDGARLAEVCEGPSGAAGVPPEALEPARELAAFVAEVGDLLPAAIGGEGVDALVLVEQVKGVPLRVRAWPKGAPATESRIVRATPMHFAPERFRPPPDYSAGFDVHVRP